MAAGPFLGAAILGAVHPVAALSRLGVEAGTFPATILAPAWRWVFYVNVPIGIVALVIAWAASSGWETPRRSGRLDIVGALLFSGLLVGALGALTLLGSRSGPDTGGLDPTLIAAVLAVVAVVVGRPDRGPGAPRGGPVHQPPAVPARRRSPPRSSCRALTGYGLATAIVGGAVFVDRVLYGGPDQQRLALGSLAGAMAIGALASGFIVRVVSLRLVTLVGLVASARRPRRHVPLDHRDPDRRRGDRPRRVRARLRATVTPRSTAAVEAVEPGALRHGGLDGHGRADGRHGGGPRDPAAYGSTTIDHLYDQVYATPDSYKAYIPEQLRGRPLRDGLVIEALETWAAGEAAQIMVGLFLVAAVVTVVAIPPARSSIGGVCSASAVPVPNPGGGNPAPDGAADPDAGIDPDLDLPVIGGA